MTVISHVPQQANSVRYCSILFLLFHYRSTVCLTLIILCCLSFVSLIRFTLAFDFVAQKIIKIGPLTSCKFANLWCATCAYRQNLPWYLWSCPVQSAVDCVGLAEARQSLVVSRWYVICDDVKRISLCRPLDLTCWQQTLTENGISPVDHHANDTSL